MKQLFTGAVLGTMMFASSAMANVDVSTTESLSTSMMNTELNQVFDTNSLDQIQAMELSSQEMKDTQGAFWPLLGAMAVGASIGVGSDFLLTRAIHNQNPTWQSYALSAGTGAVGGGFTNVMLRGAGISTSAFAPTAWNSSNRVGNVVIRANGTGVGQSVGVYKANLPPYPTVIRPSRISIPYTSAPTGYLPNNSTFGQRVILHRR